jgi:hypothetical protein
MPTALSANQGQPQSKAPVVTKLPQVTGGNTAGTTLHTTTGNWNSSGLNPTYYYAWLRDGSPISRETLPYYVISTADEGHSIQSEIKAANSEGLTKAVSNMVDVVISVPPDPDLRVPPSDLLRIDEVSILGTAIAGATLTAHVVTSGVEPIRLTYQWKIDGVPVPKETGTGRLYAFVPGKPSSQITVTVTATNSTGYVVYTGPAVTAEQ